MLESIEDYEWKEIQLDAVEKAYRNMDRDILYLEDQFTEGRETTQTEIQDWHGERYAVKHRKNYHPPDTEDETLHQTMDWNEAEAFLEAKAGDTK